VKTSNALLGLTHACGAQEGRDRITKDEGRVRRGAVKAALVLLLREVLM
jgi:hypothetical protein